MRRDRRKATEAAPGRRKRWILPPNWQPSLLAKTDRLKCLNCFLLLRRLLGRLSSPRNAPLVFTVFLFLTTPLVNVFVFSKFNKCKCLLLQTDFSLLYFITNSRKKKSPQRVNRAPSQTSTLPPDITNKYVT